MDKNLQYRAGDSLICKYHFLSPVMKTNKLATGIVSQNMIVGVIRLRRKVMPGPSRGRPRNSRRRLKAVDSRRTEWRQAANSRRRPKDKGG